MDKLTERSHTLLRENEQLRNSEQTDRRCKLETGHKLTWC